MAQQKEARTEQLAERAKRAGNPWFDDVEAVYSVEDMANIIELEGIKVLDWTDGNSEGRPAEISVEGEWGTGERLAQIAKQYNFPVYSFKISWLIYRAGGGVRWLIHFFGVALVVGQTPSLS